MNTVELTQYALGNAFDILEQVVADLTQEQADWIPPGVANPIGASYWHTVSGADEVVCRWALGQEPLHQREGWQTKVLTVSAPEPENPEGYFAWMRTIRVDLPALHEYAKETAGALHAWLGSLKPEDLERTINTPIGEHNLAQMLETFIIWHINAHCGEISALKGCQGARGYPF
jgi:DinB superfamily